MKRRTVLGGLGAVGLAGLAGCLDTIGMAEHESSPAGVIADVRGETGYEQSGIDDVVVQEDVVASETVSVTNYITEHEKRVGVGQLTSARAAVFIVLTTPQIGIAGQNFNPVEDKSAQELIELVEDNYDDIEDISHDEDGQIEILEETTDRSRFTADAVFNGHDLEVDLHVSEAVEAGDDLLVTIGVYPRDLRGREEENILALMEGVTTEIDLEDDGEGDEDDGNDDDDGDEESDGDDEEGGSDTDDDGDEESGGDEDDDDDDDDGGVLGTL